MATTSQVGRLQAHPQAHLGGKQPPQTSHPTCPILQSQSKLTRTTHPSPASSPNLAPHLAPPSSNQSLIYLRRSSLLIHSDLLTPPFSAPVAELVWAFHWTNYPAFGRPAEARSSRTARKYPSGDPCRGQESPFWGTLAQEAPFGGTLQTLLC